MEKRIIFFDNVTLLIFEIITIIFLFVPISSFHCIGEGCGVSGGFPFEAYSFSLEPDSKWEVIFSFLFLDLAIYYLMALLISFAISKIFADKKSKKRK